MDAMKVSARLDLRLHRARALTAALMREIAPHLPGDTRLGEVHDAMLAVLHANGAAWTTDEDRAAMGLEPRDGMGWTPSEKIKAEQERLDLMRMMTVRPSIHAGQERRAAPDWGVENAQQRATPKSNETAETPVK
jgi:hypothetical protein